MFCFGLHSLTTTNETLEEKCEDLRKQIEDLNREVEIERRKNERLQMEQRTNKDEMAVVIAAANAAAAATGTTAPSNLRCLRDSNVSVNMPGDLSQWVIG